MIAGAGLLDVLPQAAVLLVLAGILIALAARVFRWE
jgi:hypothetical protein